MVLRSLKYEPKKYTSFSWAKKKTYPIELEGERWKISSPTSVGDENHETGQIQAKDPSGEGRRPKWRRTKPPSGEG